MSRSEHRALGEHPMPRAIASARPEVVTRAFGQWCGEFFKRMACVHRFACDGRLDAPCSRTYVIRRVLSISENAVPANVVRLQMSRSKFVIAVRGSFFRRRVARHEIDRLDRVAGASS
jgi:hypothetical protein